MSDTIVSRKRRTCITRHIEDGTFTEGPAVNNGKKTWALLRHTGWRSGWGTRAASGCVNGWQHSQRPRSPAVTRAVMIHSYGLLCDLLRCGRLRHVVYPFRFSVEDTINLNLHGFAHANGFCCGGRRILWGTPRTATSAFNVSRGGGFVYTDRLLSYSC